MNKAKITTKVIVGDKIRIVCPDMNFGYYDIGAEAVVKEVIADDIFNVIFTKGWTGDEDDTEFSVYAEEFVVINDESKTQVKKEKEMENQEVKLKQGVYAVVETGSKSVVDVFTNRGAARYWMQGMKQEFPECSYKLAKLSVDKWIR